MIVAHVRDDRDERFANIGRIVSPPETNFQNGKIDSATIEMKEAQGGDDFKERGRVAGVRVSVHRARNGRDRGHVERDFIVGDRHAIDLHALGHIAEMR